MIVMQLPIIAAASEIDVRLVDSQTQKDESQHSLGAVPRLSSEERRRREDAVRFANASIWLEGFSVSDEARVRADRFIAGEVDLGEFLEGR